MTPPGQAVARTVITGVGVVAPTGVDADQHWRATLDGELRVGPIDGLDPGLYDSTLGGRVAGFVAAEYVDERLLVQTDRWSWMALAAARQALEDADYDPDAHDPYDTAVVLAAGSGGNEFGQREIQALWNKGPRAVGAYQSIAWFYAASTGQISIRHGTKGPSGVVATDGAGGLDSLAQARRVIRRGTPVVLAGGTEAPLSPYAMACQGVRARGLSRERDPGLGYRPFDTDANGQVPGEGGAVLIVEDLASARRRPAPHVYAEVAGYAASHDGRRPDATEPGDSRQLVRAIRGALDDAGVTAGQVDLVFADGAGIPEQDLLEAEALQEVFGARNVPVTAPQGLTGRLCSGGAALNVATAVLAMRAGVAPAVGNLVHPEPGYPLDLVHPVPRELPIETVMVVARGYGGFNSALVLRSVPA